MNGGMRRVWVKEGNKLTYIGWILHISCQTTLSSVQKQIEDDMFSLYIPLHMNHQALQTQRTAIQLIEQTMKGFPLCTSATGHTNQSAKNVVLSFNWTFGTLCTLKSQTSEFPIMSGATT